ncbi:hypothetical protein PsorP6_003682 [Peronosclerospora sorghi]|uniref:Uncharacterized protein n=1 Tax=Peronosclerospora sorghi TaxID=230839 RepID=A0ACC0VQP9_9STRA|nr:hypothetical protein PsorP6_003682 [Peronosclerospora sorghi]
MSARASRRGNSGAYGMPPSAPISGIRVRKWTKELKTIGHLVIPKWIPGRINPTEALKKGVFKKSKGRKRGSGELGRMTRSVRQHLDAPLELLSEHPVRVNSSRHSSPARTTTMPSISAETPTVSYSSPLYAASLPMSAAARMSTKQEHAEDVGLVLPIAENSVKVKAAPSATVTADPSASTLPMMSMMPSVPNQIITDVPSDEQLEMVLGDLPMLDADDSFNLDALDSAFLPTPGASTTNAEHLDRNSSKKLMADGSSVSFSEDDASANSGSSIPSGSPQSSPGLMSRSPSP